MSKFLVIHTRLDIFGGAERVCHEIVKTLVAHDQEVELLTLSLNKDKYEEITGKGLSEEIKVYSLEDFKPIGPPFSIYKRFLSMRKLIKRYKDILDYDYIFLTHGSNPYENTILGEVKRSIAYVHFPNIHYNYQHSNLKRRIYLWPFRRVVEKGIKRLDYVFTNSNYTKAIIKEVWGRLCTPEPIVVYPPVDINVFMCDKPLEERERRVVYVGRFHPDKRHGLMKKLAIEFPKYKFVSVVGVTEGMKKQFQHFSKNLPKNYVLMQNIPHKDLKPILCDSRMYVHLYKAEPFGISPIEALASGCVVLPHNSGGIREFIPKEFRWDNFDELKRKIAEFMETDTVTKA